MSPAFERGDILALTMYNSDPLVAGDIVVFNIKGRDIPIVHRIMKIHEEYIFASRGASI
jgi:signal peptidase